MSINFLPEGHPQISLWAVRLQGRPKFIGIKKKLKLDLGRPITKIAQIIKFGCGGPLPTGRRWPSTPTPTTHGVGFGEVG